MKRWFHRHEFIRMDGGQALAIDEIMFQFGYGIIGRVAERLLIAKLGPIFQHREHRVKKCCIKNELERAGTVLMNLPVF